MPRITKECREDFILNVMFSLPALPKPGAEIERLGLICRAAIEGAMPKDIQAFAKKWPTLVQRYASCEFRLESRYVAAFENSRLDWPRVNFMAYPEQIQNDAEREAFKTNVIEPARVAFKTAVIELGEAYIARNALKGRVTEISKACTTTESLAKALPELAHCIPEIEAPAPTLLPVAASQLVADLMKAGAKFQGAAA